MTVEEIVQAEHHCGPTATTALLQAFDHGGQ